MINNPFAKVFRDALIEDVVEKSLFVAYDKNEDRVKKFVFSLNKMFKNAGLPPVHINKHLINERKLIEYAQFMRGYMRDSQKIFLDITNSQTCNDELSSIFISSSHYVVACNGKVEGYKHIVNEEAPYVFWKVNMPNGLARAELEKTDETLDVKKKNLVLFMPFRIKAQEDDLRTWLTKYFHTSLDGEGLKDVNIYAAHFPINKSRGGKVFSTLETIKNPNGYIEELEQDLVAEHFLPLIAKDIELDENKNIVSATPYSHEEVVENFKNLTVMGYCAGSADAHRTLMEIKRLTAQVYDKQTTDAAVENLFLISYSFLPVQKKNPYSGAYFITNSEDDYLKKEPFTKMNAPELYEEVKYTPSPLPARISVMPDEHSFVIAHKRPERLDIIGQTIKTIVDPEYGHDISHITATRANGENFATQQFRTVLENAANGKRGKEVFCSRGSLNNINNSLTAFTVWAKRAKTRA